MEKTRTITSLPQRAVSFAPSAILYRSSELIHHLVPTPLAEGLDRQAVILELSVTRNVETLPHRLPDLLQVSQDRPSVVKLVCERDSKDLWRRFGQVRDRPHRARPGVLVQPSVCIDKRRRLALMAWWPDIIYWGSNGPSNRRAFPGDGTFADGSILLYIEGADEGQSDELSHKFNLVLTDDPVPLRDQEPPDDVVDLLERWHNYIVGRVDRKSVV